MKISFRLATKMLLAVSALFVVVILVLNLSTIYLLKEDKRDYVLQAQSTQAILAGREFAQTASQALATLRIALNSDAFHLSGIVRNQSVLFRISVESWSQKGDRKKLVAASHEAGADPEIDPRLISGSAAILVHQGFTFLNVSKVGGLPVVAVVVADRRGGSALPLRVAVGFLSLKRFSEDLRDVNLTVATRDGLVLFDTDPEAQFARKSLGKDPFFRFTLKSAVASGASEYEYEGVKYLGSYYRPGHELVVISRTEWKKIVRAAYSLTEKFILLGVMAICLGIVFSILFARTVTAPINRLYQATQQVAAGNFDVKLTPKGEDEISALTSAFIAMSKQIQEAIVERVRKARLESEVAIAATVQQTLLPENTYDDENVSIRGLYRSATECGGDWWGFFRCREKLCVMIADATGHGLPSALITATARSCISVVQRMAEQGPAFSLSPSHILQFANRAIFEGAKGKINMTFFVAVLDFERGTLSYANASHNYPWLYKKGEDGTFKAIALVSPGSRLGEVPETPAYAEVTQVISEGDILFLYTDGIIEGKNPAGDMFGKKKLRATVDANISNGPVSVITTLMGKFMEHNTEAKELDDDVTMAAVQILKLSRPSSA